MGGTDSDNVSWLKRAPTVESSVDFQEGVAAAMADPRHRQLKQAPAGQWVLGLETLGGLGGCGGGLPTAPADTSLHHPGERA